MNNATDFYNKINGNEDWDARQWWKDDMIAFAEAYHKQKINAQKSDTKELQKSDNEIKLMEISVKDLSKELHRDKNALHVRMKAFDHLIEGDEEVQVHVLITRYKGDFLDDFQKEVMYPH